MCRISEDRGFCGGYVGVTLGGGVFSDLSAVVRFLWWGFVTLVSSTNLES